MALRQCLYCKASISEFVEECPKCRKSSPFDQTKKNKNDEALNREQIRKSVLDRDFKCKECGKVLKTGYVLESGKCEECGYNNSIECSVCGKKAKSYDVEEKQFFCSMCIGGICQVCGNPVSGDELYTTSASIGHGGGSYYYKYHKRCHYNYYKNYSRGRGGGCLTSIFLFILLTLAFATLCLQIQ